MFSNGSVPVRLAGVCARNLFRPKPRSRHQLLGHWTSILRNALRRTEWHRHQELVPLESRQGVVNSRNLKRFAGFHCLRIQPLKTVCRLLWSPRHASPPNQPAFSHCIPLLTRYLSDFKPKSFFPTSNQCNEPILLIADVGDQLSFV